LKIGLANQIREIHRILPVHAIQAGAEQAGVNEKKR
jgi:hypothetical protein